MKSAWWAVAGFGAWATAALALEPFSLAPLHTRPAGIVGDGQAELTFGVSYLRDERFPFFTTPAALRSQDRVHVPQVAARFGIGGRVEIEAQHELIYLDETTAQGQRNWQYGTGDARLHTKVRVWDHRGDLPAFSVRFGTKLPNASRTDRLGTDQTDFDLLALVSKDLGAISFHSNLGIWLLGNPGSSPVPGQFDATGQDDLFVYSFAVVTRPVPVSPFPGRELGILGEINGLTGSRFGNGRTRAVAGLQIGQSSWQWYLGASAGLDTASENIGVFTGLSYRFDLGSILPNH